MGNTRGTLVGAHDSGRMEDAVVQGRILSEELDRQPWRKDRILHSAEPEQGNDNARLIY